MQLKEIPGVCLRKLRVGAPVSSRGYAADDHSMGLNLQSRPWSLWRAAGERNPVTWNFPAMGNGSNAEATLL